MLFQESQCCVYLFVLRFQLSRPQSAQSHSLTPCYPISILSYENTDLTSFPEGILWMQVWDRNINIGL